MPEVLRARLLSDWFDSGEDDRANFNFTFATEHPGELWRTMLDLIDEATELKVQMASASMAMCSGAAHASAIVQTPGRVPAP